MNHDEGRARRVHFTSYDRIDRGYSHLPVQLFCGHDISRKQPTLSVKIGVCGPWGSYNKNARRPGGLGPCGVYVTQSKSRAQTLSFERGVATRAHRLAAPLAAKYAATSGLSVQSSNRVATP